MQPASYADCYLNLYHYTRDDVAVRVGIRNYLQNGKGQQSVNALAMQGRLFSAINKHLGRTGTSVPETFDIFQYVYLRNNLSRVFLGKGAPDEIQDCLWLMDRLGLVDNMTVNWYCDTCLGIDCGGFVANYWGFGRPEAGNTMPVGWAGMLPRDFWEGNAQNRRRHRSQVDTGDAAIFFSTVKNDNPSLAAAKKADGSYDTSTGSKAYHIGLVDDLVPIGSDGTQVWLGITQSSGAVRSGGNNGVYASVGTYLVKEANDLVYCVKEDGTDRIYFTGPKMRGQSYLPWGYGSE
jgi:hypothetical protein